MTDERQPPRLSNRTRILWTVAVLLLWAACNVFVPQSGWDSERGLVVPHDTFPGDCTLCHIGGDWHTLRPDFAFDHMAKTGKPLNGAHADAGCLLCHNDAGPAAQFEAKGCAGCHQDPHSGQLGRNCTDCHNENTWQPREAIARHDRTRFPLIGAHAAVACFRCHPGAQVGNFVGASAECAHCHAGEFSRSTFDHLASGDTTSCERCHRPTHWLPAQFDHPASLPLTLGHGGRRCTDCHTGGSFTGLSPACANCHMDLYTATTSPGHAAAGFATSCEQCHDTRSWQGGAFNHRFPITSGAHRGISCNECHTTGIGPNFTCTDCHAHTRSLMDAEHRDENDYVWETSRCYSCHRNGSG